MSANKHSMTTLLQPQDVPRSRHLFATLAAAVLMAACATTAPPAPEQAVRELATQRWQALLAKDHGRAYQMAAPSYRKLKTEAQYTLRIQQVPVRWEKATVLRVECTSAERCVAKIELHSTPIAPFAPKVPIVGVLDEVWVKEDARWWMFEPL